MKNKMMLLALSVFAFAFAALPAVASAVPTVDPASGKFPLKFTSAGGHSELRSEGAEPVTCTSNSGTGEYTNGTTGKIELTFTGCKQGSTACTSSGQLSGTITTGTSEFHNIYIEPKNTTPGVLVTPPSGGVYASFNCGIIPITVTGNGIIGDLEKPTCGTKGKTGTLNFTATGASQTYKQVETAGTVYDLKSDLPFGITATAAEVAEGTVTFAEEYTLTCV
jgi:hypothetical protein